MPRSCTKFLVVWLCFYFGITTASGQIQSPTTSSGGGPGVDQLPFAPTVEFVQNGPIAARVLFVGRNPDGKRISVSAEMKNLGADVVYIALVGPSPGAFDSAGRTYKFTDISGLGRCGDLAYALAGQCFTNNNWCATRPSYYVDCLPGDSFSQLNPGASSLVALSFEGDEISNAGFLSLTMNVAMATGVRPGNERGEERGLVNLPVSFPLLPLGD